jgi:hypothetical protein
MYYIYASEETAMFLMTFAWKWFSPRPESGVDSLVLTPKSYQGGSPFHRAAAAHLVARVNPPIYIYEYVYICKIICTYIYVHI